MTAEEFGYIMELKIAQIRQTLGEKAAIYSTSDNRLGAFDRAASTLGVNPSQALLGMAVKHWVGIVDQVTEDGRGYPPDLWLLHERTGDLINYLILLQAIFMAEAAGGMMFFESQKKGEE